MKVVIFIKYYMVVTMNDIAIVINNACDDLNAYETVDAIKKAGFKNVFIQWYDKDNKISQEDIVNYIKENNLNIIFAHLGYKNINNIWLDNEIGKSLEKQYINDLNKLSKYNIDMVVMHLCAGLEAPTANNIGLSRFENICNHAKKLGIKVAFENTKIKGYQEYILDNLKLDNIGFCYDSGHDHCHFKDTFNFDKFKNKILCTHLHDNHGKEDEHLIPNDGNLDFAYVLNGLKKTNYESYLTFEIIYQKNYLEENIEDFYKKSYNKCIEINKQYRRMK